MSTNQHFHPCHAWPDPTISTGIGAWRNKIQTLEYWQQSKDILRPLVLTNGVFDLIHAGHVFSLEMAKQHGAFLMVALNSDRSAKSLNKGVARPYQSACARASVLAAFPFVDGIVFFDEPTPEKVLHTLQPQVYVKGADYAHKPLPEAKLVEQWGGRVELLPYWQGLSTTAIEQAIQEAKEEKTKGKL